MFDLKERKFYIRRRNLPEWLMLYILFMPFFLPFFQEFLHFPSVIRYTIDLAWVSLIVLFITQKKISLSKKILPFVIIISAFFVYTVICYVFNFQSVFYFLWGFRNNFRFYIAFLAFVLFLTEEDVITIFKFFDAVFWINAVVMIVQYFVLDLSQDFLGGIFGTSRGCNAGLLIFLLIVISKSVFSFMNGKENATLCFSKCGVALVASALSELKVFFVLFVIILIMSAVLTGYSAKKIVFFILASAAVVVSAEILADLFGEGNRLTFNRIIELVMASNYSTQEDIGRFTAIPRLSEQILNALPDKLFGLGLGNCDTSAFSICNTPFFVRYSNLNYSWLSSAFLFLETGYFGLLMYLSFFVVCFIKSLKERKLSKNGNKSLFSQLSMVMSVLCIIITFYNSSLRTEIGYLSYFILALPFIASKDEDRNKKIKPALTTLKR